MRKLMGIIACLILLSFAGILHAAYVDNGNGTVTDTSTGLTWENKTGGQTPDYGDPHNTNNRYAWYDSNPATNGGYAGRSGNGTTIFSTEDFTNSLNSANFGGYSDWRIPSICELNSLVNSTYTPTAINTAYFQNTQSAWYWSSTTFGSYTKFAWYLGFGGTGFGDGFDKDFGSAYARAVRGRQTGSLDKTILYVSQTSVYVDASAGIAGFSVSNAGTASFSVSNGGCSISPMPWTATVTSDDSWLSITSGSSGTDNGSFSCSFAANTGTSSRRGTIHVAASGATGSPVNVTVTQAGASTPTPLEASTLLWNGSDGSASVWTMDTSGNMATYMLYGPYPDWTARSYHRNSDGTAQMLWVRSDGIASIWTMDTSGNMTTYMLYGPYPDWTARSYHRNSDGTGNMLWVRTDGYTSLWDMGAGGNMTTYMLYGPYPDWTARSYHRNSDGAGQMLWVRTDRTASLWTMDTSNNMTSAKLYGPYPDWTAKSYYRKSDGTARMLWVRTDGYTSLWDMDTSGNMISYKLYGPYAGWAAQDYD